MKIRSLLLTLTVSIISFGFIFSNASPKGKKKKKDQVISISTRYGEMKFLLYDETPLHKENFIKLAEEGFYDSTTFHRIIKQFMIQGGDPNSKDDNPNNDGMGGPGYTIPAEFNPDFIHKKGALAAARQGDNVNPKKESSGSQFYIVQGRPVKDNELQRLATFKGTDYSEEQKKIYKELGGTPHLDGEYTVFGEIIDGIEVIDSIAAVKTNMGNPRPIEPIYMKVSVDNIKRKKITKIYNYSYSEESDKKANQ